MTSWHVTTKVMTSQLHLIQGLATGGATNHCHILVPKSATRGKSGSTGLYPGVIPLLTICATCIGLQETIKCREHLCPKYNPTCHNW